ncbi:hypothetical protein KQI42_17585 [Tissierella sp. MSJ-40]|uniref:Recombinase domain-containing protein n=1 Tax=Tissierella simiarum TaxID=2841534 RepID=A0ABS6EA70_9FIRM|nr:hypothetical protein [Tissierella simiarum]MBU5439832.1 hypothetical protein [Tissierella simiarum]
MINNVLTVNENEALVIRWRFALENKGLIISDKMKELGIPSSLSIQRYTKCRQDHKITDFSKFRISHTSPIVSVEVFEKVKAALKAREQKDEDLIWEVEGDSDSIMV